PPAGGGVSLLADGGPAGPVHADPRRQAREAVRPGEAPHHGGASRPRGRLPGAAPHHELRQGDQAAPRGGGPPHPSPPPPGGPPGPGRPYQERHRITNYGRVIRRLRVDELPQILHLLTGDMSLVGPRPLLAEHVVEAGGGGRRPVVRPGLTRCPPL